MNFLKNLIKLVVLPVMFGLPLPPCGYIDVTHGPPPPHVVNNFVRNGCHFVAIKKGSHAENERRNSFSQAEYTLVYLMNHTQFLTYVLLKLFLTEIINNEFIDEDNLLCSYYMRTIFFRSYRKYTTMVFTKYPGLLDLKFF